MGKHLSEKQMVVSDWLTRIEKSPSNCERSVTNAYIKQQGGHPLSASEHNLLEAYESFLLTKLK